MGGEVTPPKLQLFAEGLGMSYTLCRTTHTIVLAS